MTTYCACTGNAVVHVASTGSIPVCHVRPPVQLGGAVGGGVVGDGPGEGGIGGGGGGGGGEAGGGGSHRKTGGESHEFPVPGS